MLAFLLLNLLSSLIIALESLFSFYSTSFIMASILSLISLDILAILAIVTSFYYHSHCLEMNMKVISILLLIPYSIFIVKV